MTSSLRDQLRIGGPCSQAWEDIVGDDKRRFCSRDSENVQGLTQLSDGPTLALVQSSLRQQYAYLRRESEPADRIVPSQLTQSRRLGWRGWIGSGLLALSLVPSVAAKSESEQSPIAQICDSPDAAGSLSTLEGVVSAGRNNVRAGVRIRMRQVQSGQEWYSYSDRGGYYSLCNLEPGTYELCYFLEGFKDECEEIQLGPGTNIYDQTMRTGTVMCSISFGSSGAFKLLSPWDWRGKLPDDIDLQAMIQESLISYNARYNDEQEDLVDEFIDAIWEDSLNAVHTYLKKLKENGLTLADIKDSDGSTPLMHATHSPQLVRLLLAKGSDPNHENIWGTTALMYAGAEGQEESASLLLAHGANVKHFDCLGRTPLMTAAVGGGKVTQLLLDKGANPNIHDRLGRSILDYGVELSTISPYFEGAYVLLENGVDIHHGPPGIPQPLFVAAKRGATEVLEGLVYAGADLETLNEAGETPLIVATRWKRRSAVERLLYLGAQVNAAAQDGMTVLHHAVVNNDIGMVDLLLQYNADPSLKDRAGQTPRSLATASTDPIMAGLF